MSEICSGFIFIDSKTRETLLFEKCNKEWELLSGVLNEKQKDLVESARDIAFDLAGIRVDVDSIDPNFKFTFDKMEGEQVHQVNLFLCEVDKSRIPFRLQTSRWAYCQWFNREKAYSLLHDQSLIKALEEAYERPL